MWLEDEYLTFFWLLFKICSKSDYNLGIKIFLRLGFLVFDIGSPEKESKKTGALQFVRKSNDRKAVFENIKNVKTMWIILLDVSATKNWCKIK